MMKFIVEYFCDLVVDDCYFGVEFLIFDVDMLVWIVECEIECCVEVYMELLGIVLCFVVVFVVECVEKM